MKNESLGFVAWLMLLFRYASYIVNTDEFKLARDQGIRNLLFLSH